MFLSFKSSYRRIRLRLIKGELLKESFYRTVSGILEKTVTFEIEKKIVAEFIRLQSIFHMDYKIDFLQLFYWQKYAYIQVSLVIFKKLNKWKFKLWIIELTYPLYECLKIVFKFIFLGTDWRSSRRLWLKLEIYGPFWETWEISYFPLR